MKSKKLSVIVTSYNKEKYISRCLRSLINQTLDRGSFEIIIIDDYSTDNSKYVIDQFINPKDDFIKVIENKSNLGLPASLNKGIKISKGKYIVRVDSDDYVSEQFLFLLLFYAENNIDMDAIACDYFVFKENENKQVRVDCMKYPIGCGIIFQKQQLLNIDMYDETFLINEEIDLRIRFEKKYKIHHLKLPLYRYRKHDMNMTNNKKAIKIYDKKIIDKHPNNDISKKYQLN
tara:strand:+ start:243 stop:938 length:696 start_codon:yes stop_codon:yes gene_type:complete